MNVENYRYSKIHQPSFKAQKEQDVRKITRAQVIIGAGSLKFKKSFGDINADNWEQFQALKAVGCKIGKALENSLNRFFDGKTDAIRSGRLLVRNLG